MKRSVFISVITILVWIFLLFLIRLGTHLVLANSIDNNHSTEPILESEDVLVHSPEPVQRENITFILGVDNDSKNAYYAAAEKYYKANPKDRTEYLVTTCQSLVEVRNYLSENKPANGLPWGRVNLVSHGNQWLGLGVPLVSGSKRSTTESIKKADEKDILIELDDKLLDEKSELFIHACGIGNNAELLKSLAHAFGGSETRPRVIASRLFEIYRSDNEGIPNRLFAKSHLAFYKTGYRPGDIRLARQLKKRYPKDNIDWRDALTRTEARWAGDIYHYTFNIPVKWIVIYPHADSVPDISTEEKKKDWVNNQTELTKVIAEIGIPPDMFDWRFRSIRLRVNDGSFKPAIRAKGYCTVLCVLKPLVNINGENMLSLEPDENDTLYFGIY